MQKIFEPFIGPNGWYCHYEGQIGIGLTKQEAEREAVDKYDKQMENYYMGQVKNQVTEEMDNTGMDIDEVLAERGNRYGEYRSVAMLSQALKEALQVSPSWEQMEPHQQESLEMICNKVSRICNGDPYYVDSWRDIAGYAQLIVNELEDL
tara:strand:+ start:1403 stop:1852 length:450 start_codon:yes stop_codon:yes gene_type:complete